MLASSAGETMARVWTVATGYRQLLSRQKAAPKGNNTPRTAALLQSVKSVITKLLALTANKKRAN